MRDLSQTLSNVSHKKYSRLSPLRLNIGLLVSIIVLGLVYLFSVNTLATEGFKIKQLTVEISQLDQQHKDLELQNSTLQSISTIQQESQQLDFVPTTNVTYLKDDNFALK